LTGYVRYRPIRRSCGVEKASEELRQTHKWLRNNEPLDNDLWNSSMIEQRIAPSTNDGSHSIDRRQAASPVYTIDTYFHIVADSTSASPSSPNYISDDMVSAQFNYLTQAYAGYSIGYRLMGIDRSTNNIWAANGDDYAMKSTLRRGTYSSLNIYYQSQLQATANTPGITPGDTLLGFCSLPSAGVTATTPVDDYVVDGCNILSGTMPGGNYGGYNLGGTTVHEVGHWNGLLHTFNGGTCNVADFGDYVADTPQEAISTSEFSFVLFPPSLPCLRQDSHYAYCYTLTPTNRAAQSHRRLPSVQRLMPNQRRAGRVHRWTGTGRQPIHRAGI
jgi:hypothetical protein